MKKRIGVFIQAAFYLFAGANHFVHPEFYLPLIPEYLPFHHAINAFAGVAEVLFGVGLLIPVTRNWSAIGIIAMLVAFIPSHVFFIEIGGCVQDGLCAPLWVGWVRLVIIHPLLIWWAWSVKD